MSIPVCKNKKELGLLFKRCDLQHVRVQNIINIINIQLVEIDIFIASQQALLDKQWEVFDALVGDCKCQVRVSMLLAISQTKDVSRDEIIKLIQRLNDLKSRTICFLQKLQSLSTVEGKNLTDWLKGNTAVDLLQKHDLYFEVSHDVILLGLCYVLSGKFVFKEEVLGHAKRKELLQLAKKQLALMSIEHERELVHQFKDADVFQVLKYIYKNNVCSMTAFFPTLKPILQKIKYTQQGLVIKHVVVCKCGGIKRFHYRFFQSHDGKKFEEVSVNSLKDVVVVVEGYQFAGSLADLKKISSLPDCLESVVRCDFFQLCVCNNLVKSDALVKIEEVILANAAQHAQFTNGAQIDWEGLGLLESDLKKEFDYLNTLSGYSINDMSKFCINHIYASTVEQVLQEQEALQATLK